MRRLTSSIASATSVARKAIIGCKNKGAGQEMSSPALNFLAFLETLAGMDRAEIIITASRESHTAKDIKIKRGDKVGSRKLTEYISDLGLFLYFVRYGDNGSMSWPEAFLASPEWKNTQRARYGGLLGDSE